MLRKIYKKNVMEKDEKKAGRDNRRFSIKSGDAKTREEGKMGKKKGAKWRRETSGRGKRGKKESKEATRVTRKEARRR